MEEKEFPEALNLQKTHEYTQGGYLAKAKVTRLKSPDFTRRLT